MVTARDLALLRHFTVRALRARFEGTFLGSAWAVLQPLVMLGVYSLMFVTVLKARLPPAIDLAFVPFLAVGLWPWTAFSESLVQGSLAIQDNAALLSKVALPRAVLVLSRVVAAFALHVLGFALILAAIAAFGHPIRPGGLPIAIGVLGLLAIAAAGLALALAAIQVFLRDVAQVIAQLLTAWFFLTPIFYPREMLSPRLQPWLDANPITAFVEAIRWSLFGVGQPGVGWWALLWFPPLALALGIFVFRRLSRHFEDFL